MIHPTRILLTAALGVIMSAMTAQADTLTPPYYSYKEIAPGKGFAGVNMNAAGDIAGYLNIDISTGLTHAAVILRGKLIDLGALVNPAIISTASFVNLEGEVTFTTFTGGSFGFVGYVYRAGKVYPLHFPPGASMNEFNGLNDFGQAVGDFVDPTTTNGGTVSGFLLNRDGSYLKIPIIPFYAGGSINIFGQVVGTYRTPGNDIYTVTVREPGGRLVQLGYNRVPTAINDLGHALGYDGNGNNGYLYAGGREINLGHLGGYTGPLAGFSLNNFDTVIGGQGDGKKFIYFNGTLYDLATLIKPLGSIALDVMCKINDNGEILAMKYDPTTTFFRTYLLSPIKSVHP